ncbi:hypothetical protein BDW22DRAFT_1466275 [Trametopsis cervina]|nr:hypothetical protein BDW22DRAFT_1466275 [Trametopsis cervina]
MIRNSGLAGFAIPGMQERLITTLFADDTTVYLSEHDSYADLHAILDEWCHAAGAKFNIEKTEIIPVGSPAYRQRVMDTRCFDATGDPLAQNIHIAQDGTLTRILGVWIGNAVDQAAPWQPVLKAINRRLAEWDRPGLTVFGRRLVVNMEIGGRIQYLTKVQGMPRTIAEDLTRIIRKFIWPNLKSPPISMTTLTKPIKQGGLGLIDIPSRPGRTSLMPSLRNTPSSRDRNTMRT